MLSFLWSPMSCLSTEKKFRTEDSEMWLREMQLTMTTEEPNKLDVICKDYVKLNQCETI